MTGWNKIPKRKFTSGGVPPEDPTASSVKSFYNTYLNSPNYRNRLLGQGYKNPDSVISDRLTNLNTSKVVNKTGKGSDYNSDTNTVNIDKNQLPKFNINLGDLYSHELSHAAGADVYTKNPNLGMNYQDNSLINSKNKLSSYSGKDVNKQHDAHSRELKADMDNLRYNLFKDKIYDTGTQTFDKSFLQKAKSKYSTDGNFKRLTERLNDDDLIQLMNKVAVNNNSQEQEIPVAAYGGNIKDMTGWNKIKPKRTNLPKYDFGGFIGDKKNAGAITAAGNFAGGIVDAFNDPNNPEASLSALSGGIKGAAVGTAVLPGVGTIIGGGLGAISGLIGGIGGRKKYLQQKEDERKRTAEAELARSNSVVRSYDTQGINDVDMYAEGGPIGDVIPPYKKVMRPQDYPTYNKSLLTNGKFIVEKADGSMGQWGNDLNAPQNIPNLPMLAPPIPISDKARGMDNTYNPGRDRQQNNNIPILKSPTGRTYADGGSINIKPQNRGKFTAYLERTGDTAHEALNSDNPDVRKMANFAINIGHTKKAFGGKINNSNKVVFGNQVYAGGGDIQDISLGQDDVYEAEQGEVVQGNNTQLEDGTPLSNDMQQVNGQSHENGGTMGVGGDRIFSDRLKVTPALQLALKAQGISVPNKSTYADISNKIGKLKGKMEDKQTSNSQAAQNTARLTLPRLEQSLNDVFADQEIGKQTRSLKKFGYGGVLPKKYAYGDLLPQATGIGAGDIEFPDFIGGVPANANILPQTTTATTDPSFLSGVGNFLKDNSGQIINATGYLANLRTIGGLDTSVKRNLLPAPVYNYNDRTGSVVNRNNSMLRTGIRGLTGRGASVNASNIAQLYSKTLEGNSQIALGEAARRDQYNNDYYNRADRINGYNTGTINDANDRSRDLNNEKLGLQSNARNSFIQGIMGNAAMKQQKELDSKRLAIIGLAGDSNGVLTRLQKSNPALYKRLFSID